MLDVKFDLVKKSLSLSKLHWTLWLPGWYDCICDNPKVENLGSKKFFWKTSFDVLMEWSRIITHGVRQLFLVTNHVRFWKKQNALLLCQSWIFSKTVSITFATHFCGTCPHTKKNELSTQRCFKKTKFMLTVERTKSFSAEPVVFEKTFWIDPSCKKRRNFEVSIFCLVWEEVWNEIGWNSFPVDSLQV